MADAQAYREAASSRGRVVFVLWKWLERIYVLETMYNEVLNVFVEHILLVEG